MDLRVQKTRRAIKDAFLSLIAVKPVNKITVTELTKKAVVSKAAFYLHYNDIYDLLEQLRNEVISEIIKSIPHPEMMITKPEEVISDMLSAFSSKNDMIWLLFRSGESCTLSKRIEYYIKEAVYQNFPVLKNDIKFDIVLTFLIQGGFYAYLSFPGENSASAKSCIESISGLVIKNMGGAALCGTALKTE